jgi:hypothetical protein
MDAVFALSYNGQGGAGWREMIGRTMKTREVEWWTERLWKQKQREAEALEKK